MIHDRCDKVVSELTLIEMASMIRRRQYGLDKKAIPDSPDIIDLYGKVLYILQEMDLRVLFSKESIIGSPFGNVTSPYFKAIELSSDIPMRTLDLLHLGYASEIGSSLSISLDFLIRDNDFAKFSEKILEILGIRVLVLSHALK